MKKKQYNKKNSEEKLNPLFTSHKDITVENLIKEYEGGFKGFIKKKPLKEKPKDYSQMRQGEYEKKILNEYKKQLLSTLLYYKFDDKYVDKQVKKKFPDEKDYEKKQALKIKMKNQSILKLYKTKVANATTLEKLEELCEKDILLESKFVKKNSNSNLFKYLKRKDIDALLKDITNEINKKKMASLPSQPSSRRK